MLTWVVPEPDSTVRSTPSSWTTAQTTSPATMPAATTARLLRVVACIMFLPRIDH
jgi:hypothetical protein